MGFSGCSPINEMIDVSDPEFDLPNCRMNCLLTHSPTVYTSALSMREANLVVVIFFNVFSELG